MIDLLQFILFFSAGEDGANVSFSFQLVDDPGHGLILPAFEKPPGGGMDMGHILLGTDPLFLQEPVDDFPVFPNAIMLNVLLEVEQTNKQIPAILKYLTQNADRMYSTQERSFAFLALGKAASLNANANVNVDIIVDGKSINKFSGKDITVKDDKLNSANVTLKANGKGEVYYFWSAEGVKLNEKVKEEDSFMQIKRSFYSYKTGRLIPDFRFYQGELVVCKIEMTGLDRNAENIVITDLIPAGFEIENPRLNPAPSHRERPLPLERRRRPPRASPAAAPR